MDKNPKKHITYKYPARLSSLMPSFMKRFPKKQVFLHDLRKNWKKIVGKNIASHSFPYDINNETLHINVDDPIWIQELTLVKDEIKQKIHAFFTFEPYVKVVESLKFRNGELYINPPEPEQPKTELTVNSETLRLIDEKVARIEDPELRKAMRHYLIECNYRELRDEEKTSPDE